MSRRRWIVASIMVLALIGYFVMAMLVTRDTPDRTLAGRYAPIPLSPPYSELTEEERACIDKAPGPFTLEVVHADGRPAESVELDLFVDRSSSPPEIVPLGRTDKEGAIRITVPEKYRKDPSKYVRIDTVVRGIFGPSRRGANYWIRRNRTWNTLPRVLRLPPCTAVDIGLTDTAGNPIDAPGRIRVAAKSRFGTSPETVPLTLPTNGRGRRMRFFPVGLGESLWVEFIPDVTTRYSSHSETFEVPEVAAESNATTFDLALPAPPSLIFGRLLTDKGEPISTTPLRIHWTQSTTGVNRSSRRFDFAGGTDQDGRFLIRNEFSVLDAERQAKESVRLTTNPAGDPDSKAYTVVVDVPLAPTREELDVGDLRMTELPVVVAGTFLTEDGKPADTSILEIERRPRDAYLPMESLAKACHAWWRSPPSADGRFTFRGLLKPDASSFGQLLWRFKRIDPPHSSSPAFPTLIDRYFRPGAKDVVVQQTTFGAVRGRFPPDRFDMGTKDARALLVGSPAPAQHGLEDARMDEERFHRVTLDHDGNFVMRFLSPGVYDLRYSADADESKSHAIGQVTIRPSEELDLGDIE